MTEFKIKPVKEVNVNDLVQDELEDFLYLCRISQVTSAIWVDGVIILLGIVPFTETYAKIHAEGIRNYERVTFVKFPKYEKTVKWNGGNYELPLRNYSNFLRFKEFAKWIKSQPEWNTIPGESK